MPSTYAVAGRPSDARAVDLGASRPGMVSAGLILTYASAATIPWTGVGIGGISLGEVFLALAVAALLGADLERPLPRIPPWAWALVLTVMVTGAANQFFPPGSAYLAGRDLLLDNYLVIHTPETTAGNLSVMLHLVLRIVLLPVMFGLAHAYDRRALFRAASAFVAGSVISALIAFTDSRGWTSIGPHLVGVGVADQRASGLTQHPNVVGMTCVLALPLALWQALAMRGRARLWAALLTPALLLGLYASRSRSGAVAAALAGLVALGWLPQYRRHLPAVGFVLAAVAGAMFVINPGLGQALLDGLRLTGGDTSGSDRARSIVNVQAEHDFLHSPFRGIGFEVAEQAHVVYLQALAVGGVILLVGLLIFFAGALTRSAKLATVHPLAIPLFAATLGEAMFDLVQNALTPALVYVTGGLIAALPMTASDAPPTTQDALVGAAPDAG